MARITHVKKAQPRYRTVPVIDPETGEQKKTPMMKNGVQMKSKSGRPIFLRITTKDKTRPLPLLQCDAGARCRHETRDIQIGEPYKHISPRSGPYGGRQLNRHEDCPTWDVWEYSSSLSARIAQIQSEGAEALSADFETAEDLEAILEDIASNIEGLADEKEEAASSIEDGFGHETYQSAELNEQADELRNWAESVRGADIPDAPEGGDDCEECGGTGSVDNPDYDPDDEESDEEEETDCDACGGTGQTDEPSDEQLEAWREEARDSAQSALDDVSL